MAKQISGIIFDWKEQLQTVDIVITDQYMYCVLRCEPSPIAVDIPRLSQMSGIMGNSLDEDDDYDS